ncbi:MAG: endolytic transglycosylase MltG [Actinomycetota bacterium]
MIVILKKALVVATILALSALIVFGLSRAFVYLTRPAPEPVNVVIKPGFSTAEIAENLSQAGLVDNAVLFKLYIIRNGAETRIKAGEYRLKTGLSYKDVLTLLLKGPKTKYYSVTIPEGFTLREIAGVIGSKTHVSGEEFLRFANKDYYDLFFLSEIPTDNLEGYLFPKTYLITERMNAHDVVKMMLLQFQKEVSPLDFTWAKARNLGLHQIVTVASMIEEEVKIPEERSEVAAVIYNRLNGGMPLQIDATVQYALPERKSELTYDDLKVPSPYNTYLNPGLPPGPITSPGLASIQAALKPANVDYLYYVLTGADGSHTFTSSYDEFSKIKEERGR